MSRFFFILLLVVIFMGEITANINPNHERLFRYTGEELIVYGGAGGGKSYSIADKLLIQSVSQGDRRLKTLVIRKTFPSLRATCLDILESRAYKLGIRWNLNKADWQANVGKNMAIQFQSLNNKDDFMKLQSRTDVDFIWFNELLEMREADYEEALRRLRGGESKYQQIISDFNPIDEYSWVNVRFFQKNINNVLKLRYNVHDNHPDYLATDKAQRYINRLRATESYNKNLYDVYYLGEWGHLEGFIYDWPVVSNSDLPTSYDEIFYGGDFGFSIDPATVVRIYRKGDVFWLEELIYKTGLTNQQLAHHIKSKVKDVQKPFYFDSAEPKSIQELFNEGINAIGADKGPESVRYGIDFLKSKDIRILEGSENIIKERKSYIWQTDKNNDPIRGKPVSFNNHTMDATRYAINTHCNTSPTQIRMLEI